VPVATDHPLFNAFWLEAPAATPSVRDPLDRLDREIHDARAPPRGQQERPPKRPQADEASRPQVVKGIIMNVHVHWVPIIPKESPAVGREWQMPPGWNQEVASAAVWLQEID
jgi:hypothetical protein